MTLKTSTWNKEGDVLITSGIALPLGFQGSPTLTTNTYMTWKCPEKSVPVRKIFLCIDHLEF